MREIIDHPDHAVVIGNNESKTIWRTKNEADLAAGLDQFQSTLNLEG